MRIALYEPEIAGNVGSVLRLGACLGAAVDLIEPLGFGWDGYRFHFYSDEGHPREPMHIHVERDDVDCKFWLYPEIRLAYNHGFKAREVKQLTEVVEARRTDIERAWNEHFT